MSSYVKTELDEQARNAFAGFNTGDRVEQTGGLKAGRTGTVISWGRSARADREFKENQDNATLAGRELTADDYECLIDNEGPVVRFEGWTDPQWFPGQSMGVLTPAK